MMRPHANRPARRGWLSRLLGWNTTSYVLMSAFTGVVFLIIVVWWPLVTGYTWSRISSFWPNIQGYLP